MKKLFILFCLISLSFVFAGTNVNRSGTTKYHNWNAYSSWDNASPGYKSNNIDTNFFLKDSATVAAFSTTELRSKSALNSNSPLHIPDSLRFCIVSNNDSINIDTAYAGLQYSFDGTKYIDIGAAIKIIYAADNFKQLNCYSRPFVPDAKFRIFYYNHTATDTSHVFRIKAWAQ